MTIQRIFDKRPADIPQNWLIFNAPRPLCGARCWTGEFRHGIYYAAVDPADYAAAVFVRQNDNLDGYLTEYPTEAEVRLHAAAKIAVYSARCDYPLTLDDYDYSDYQEWFWHDKGREEIDAERVFAGLGTAVKS